MKRWVFNVATGVSLVLLLAWVTLGERLVPASLRIIAECWPRLVPTVLLILPLAWLAKAAVGGIRRLQRRPWLFNTACFLSLVFMMMTGLLWVTSGDVSPAVYYYSVHSASPWLCELFSFDGGIWFVAGRETAGPLAGAHVEIRDVAAVDPVDDAQPTWSYFVVDWYRYVDSSFDGQKVVVADWWLALMFAVVPAVGLICRLRHQRPWALCEKCGYDLRATSDRCPECGTTVPEGHVVRVESCGKSGQVCRKHMICHG